jgi:preprotein translocase subunit YajC
MMLLKNGVTEMKRSLQWSVGIGAMTFGTLVFADIPGSGLMSSSAWSQGLMFVAFAAVFYFLILRPQSKRAKEHQQLVMGLQKGDEVITSGGLLGKITRITDNFLVIMIAEGVEVPVQRQAITTSVPKGTMKSI